MFGWLGGAIGSLFGGRGTPADLASDQIRHEIISQPFGHTALSLDPSGGETPQMREMYLDLYQKEGVVRAAINGLVDAVASADVTAEPADRGDPASRDVAEFLMWSVEQSEGGWPAILTDTTLPALLFGHSLGEPTLQVVPHPKRGDQWALQHLRSLDTRFLRLRTDVFRNVTSVISTVRGMEPFDPAKVVLFTYRRVFHNPFGNPTMRAAYRDACLIEDAYKLWYLALKMYGEPYLYGKVDKPEHRKQMQDALVALRAGGVLVSPKTDDVQILSLSAAVNFSAFEAKVKNLRENVFLAIRGAYLPFVEGVGGSDAHGDTEVGKLSSDTSEYLLSQAVGRCLNKQLVPKLIYPNFGEVPLPVLKLGGLNWDKIKNAGDTLEKVKKAFPGRLSMSAKRVAAILGIPPAEGPDDEINVNEAGPDDGGGGGGAPQPGQPGTPPAAALPAGSATDGPAALPAAPAPAIASDFAAEHAPRYADYVLPDRHGRYPGDLHAQFGLGVQAFADRTGLVRKAAKGGTWLWVPRPQPDGEPKTFSADPSPAGTGVRVTPGAPELAVAMLDAYAAGDDALADALADLADDPEGLAELVADVEAGTHGQPGVKALSAMVRTFAAGTRTFGWVADPTPRSKGRATNTESGAHAYGKRAQQLLAAQGRADRGEPEPEHPARAKARELKEAREPAREKARAAWKKVTEAPHTMTADDLGALREHLDSLTRDEVRAEVKRIRGGHGGKLKAELIDALKDHARETMAGAAKANVRPAAADPARMALAGMQPNRYKVVTADGEEVPAGKGYERWEGDQKVGYTAGQAAKVAAGVTAEEGQRRIADHERAAADPKLDPFERDRHAETAAQLRGHHAAAFPGAGRRVGMPKEEPAGLPDDGALADATVEPLSRPGAVHGAGGLAKVTAGGKPHLFKAASGVESKREEATAAIAALAGVPVPPARAATVGGKPGVLSSWVEGKSGDRGALVAAAKADPAAATAHAMFNFVAGAEDRHAGNYMVDGSGAIHSIDHSDSVPADRNPADAAALMGQDDVLDAMQKAQGGGEVRFDPGAVKRVAAAVPAMAAELRRRGMEKEAAGLEARGKVLAALADHPEPTEGRLAELAKNGGAAKPAPDPDLDMGTDAMYPGGGETPGETQQRRQAAKDKPQRAGGKSPATPDHDLVRDHLATAPEAAKPYLDAALANADGKDGRRLRKELASAHADAHQSGKLTPEADAAFGKVMEGLGVKPLHEVGTTVPFDPATMESTSGISTGSPVTVQRRGWSGLYGDAGTGHENVGNNVRRAVVEPAAADAPHPVDAAASLYDRAATASKAEIDAAKDQIAALPAKDRKALAARLEMSGNPSAADIHARILDRWESATRSKLIGRAAGTPRPADDGPDDPYAGVSPEARAAAETHDLAPSAARALHSTARQHGLDPAALAAEAVRDKTARTYTRPGKRAGTAAVTANYKPGDVDMDDIKRAAERLKAGKSAPTRLDQLNQWAAAKPESEAARAAVERATAPRPDNSGNSPRIPSTAVDDRQGSGDTTPVPATPAGGTGGKPMTPETQGYTRNKFPATYQGQKIAAGEGWTKKQGNGWVTYPDAAIGGVLAHDARRERYEAAADREGMAGDSVGHDNARGDFARMLHTGAVPTDESKAKQQAKTLLLTGMAGGLLPSFVADEMVAAGYPAATVAHHVRQQAELLAAGQGDEDRYAPARQSRMAADARAWLARTGDTTPVPATPAGGGGTKMTTTEPTPADRAGEAKAARVARHAAAMPPAAVFASDKQREFYADTRRVATTAPASAWNLNHAQTAAGDLLNWYLANHIPQPADRAGVSKTIDLMKNPKDYARQNTEAVKPVWDKFWAVAGKNGDNLKAAFDARRAELSDADKRATYSDPAAFEEFVLRPVFGLTEGK